VRRVYHHPQALPNHIPNNIACHYMYGHYILLWNIMVKHRFASYHITSSSRGPNLWITTNWRFPRSWSYPVVMDDPDLVLKQPWWLGDPPWLEKPPKSDLNDDQGAELKSEEISSRKASGRMNPILSRESRDHDLGLSEVLKLKVQTKHMFMVHPC